MPLFVGWSKTKSASSPELRCFGQYGTFVFSGTWIDAGEKRSAKQRSVVSLLAPTSEGAKASLTFSVHGSPVSWHVAQQYALPRFWLTFLLLRLTSSPPPPIVADAPPGTESAAAPFSSEITAGEILADLKSLFLFNREEREVASKSHGGRRV